ncbi:solute carrier family 23 protein, partial [Enterococcus faecalis]|uniref:solute carrier family 23 protein n=1 Tax=Enterococcus faecalis TaxID=1351 RepID=UPI0024078D2E
FGNEPAQEFTTTSIMPTFNWTFFMTMAWILQAVGGGESIGVLAITRVHSVFVIGGAAVFAVALGFVGKLSALILSIPGPVISGISFVLFGVIAASGLKI